MLRSAIVERSLGQSGSFPAKTLLRANARRLPSPQVADPSRRTTSPGGSKQKPVGHDVLTADRSIAAMLTHAAIVIAPSKSISSVFPMTTYWLTPSNVRLDGSGNRNRRERSRRIGSVDRDAAVTSLRRVDDHVSGSFFVELPVSDKTLGERIAVRVGLCVGDDHHIGRSIDGGTYDQG